MDSFHSKYKVLNKIGEGSFSEVLKCEHRMTKIHYAAKRLRKLYKTRDSIQFCAEIIAAKKVPYHPNILNMLEYYYDPISCNLIFVFELMDLSMYDYLKTKRRPLVESKVKNYLFQILNGLGHLHKYGLFHRDIKPENVLIKLPSLFATTVGYPAVELVKIGDLGSMRGIYSKQPYTEYISTRWYRSPECLLTVGHYGPKMDVWSTGCVFFEMLTLKPLFPGANEIDQLAKIHHTLGAPSIQFLSKLKSKSRNCICFPKLKGVGIDFLLPTISEKGKAILKLMIEYDPDRRYNVRRLLRHKYFEDLSTVRSQRSLDDHWFSSNRSKKDGFKRKHYSDEILRTTACQSETVYLDKPFDKPKNIDRNKNRVKQISSNKISVVENRASKLRNKFCLELSASQKGDLEQFGKNHSKTISPLSHQHNSLSQNNTVKQLNSKSCSLARKVTGTTHFELDSKGLSKFKKMNLDKRRK